MKITTVENLYLYLLQDMHSCERQIVKALPKLAKAANHAKLKAAFTGHLAESKEHLERLNQILSGLSKGPGRKVCEAAAGLVKEGAELIEADADEEVRDVGLICAAQRVEHYEIAMYGCLRTYAALLERGLDVKLLDMSLKEEKEADKSLTVLAMRVINDKARTKGVTTAKTAGVAAR